MADDEDRAQNRQLVRDAIKAGITRRSARDMQSSIGPSEIGNLCDYCVGYALTRKYPQYRVGLEATPFGGRPTRFGLKAWVGTAVHEKLEKEVEFPGLVKEQEFPVCELEGYGPIVAHIDTTWLEQAILVDYKTKDLGDIQKIQLQKSVPVVTLVQLMVYGYAILQAGHELVDVGVCYIPRDSNSAEDIWTAFAPYNQVVVDEALRRLSAVWELVQKGELPLLERDPACFECRRDYSLITTR